MDIIHADFWDRILRLNNRMGIYLLRFTFFAWTQMPLCLCTAPEQRSTFSRLVLPGSTVVHIADLFEQ